MIKEFCFERANSIDDAVRMITAGATPLAGGTDLVPLLKHEVKDIDTLVDLSRLDDMKQIVLSHDVLHIGAMCTLKEIEEHSVVRELLPSVAFAAKCVASPQIRSVGTIGGNIMQDRRCMYFNQSCDWRSSIAKCYKTGGQICHQSPVSLVCRAPYYSDIATAFAACGAQAVIIRGNHQKTVSIMQLCEEHRDINGTADKEKILVLDFLIPVGKDVKYNRFIKESIRQSIDFPTFNAACCILESESGIKISLAAGAAAGVPIMLSETCDYLKQNIDCLSKHIEDAKELAVAEIGKKAVLVKETAVSVKTKRRSFHAIGILLDDVARFMEQY